MADQTRAGVKVVIDRTNEVTKAIQQLVGFKIGVGWPESSADRDEFGDMNNPTLGYIHEHGAPEANIPARPALSLGIKRAQGKINSRMQKAGKLALDGKAAASERQMLMMGQEVADAVRAVITDGIPPPLKDSTLLGRRRQRKGGRKEASAEIIRRTGGAAPGVDLAKPLFFTGQLARAVNYVALSGKEGKK